MNEPKGIWEALRDSIQNSHEQFELIESDFKKLKEWMKGATKQFGNHLVLIENLNERLQIIEKKLEINHKDKP